MFFTVAMYASPDCHAADVGMSVRCWFLCRSCAFILPCNFNMKANYCYFITLQIKLNLYTFLNLQQLALSTIQSTTADCVAMTVTRHLLATIFFLRCRTSVQLRTATLGLTSGGDNCTTHLHLMMQLAVTSEKIVTSIRLLYLPA